MAATSDPSGGAREPRVAGDWLGPGGRRGHRRVDLVEVNPVLTVSRTRRHRKVVGEERKRGRRRLNEVAALR